MQRPAKAALQKSPTAETDKLERIWNHLNWPSKQPKGPKTFSSPIPSPKRPWGLNAGRCRPPHRRGAPPLFHAIRHVHFQGTLLQHRQNTQDSAKTPRMALRRKGVSRPQPDFQGGACKMKGPPNFLRTLALAYQALQSVHQPSYRQLRRGFHLILDRAARNPSKRPKRFETLTVQRGRNLIGLGAGTGRIC